MTKDWALHKKRIIQLYKMEGMTLEQVREHMIRERNFKAGYAPSPLPLSSLFLFPISIYPLSSAPIPSFSSPLHSPNACVIKQHAN